MNCVITFENLPPELEKWAKPVLEELPFMIPGWIEELSIRYDPADKNLMFTRMCYRLRWCSIYFTGHSLAASETERRLTLIHELVHVLLCPFIDTTAMAVKAMPKKTRPIFETLFHDHLEAAAEDTARAFLRAHQRIYKYDE